MKVNIGDLIYLGGSKAIYQVVKELQQSDVGGMVSIAYFIRRIFNAKLEFKPEKCQIASNMFFSPIDETKKKEIQNIINNNDDIKTFVNNMDSSTMYIYKTYEHFLISKKDIKNVQKSLNIKSGEFLDFDAFSRKIKEYEKDKTIIPITLSDTTYLPPQEKYFVCTILLGLCEEELYHKDIKWRDVKIKKYR